MLTHIYIKNFTIVASLHLDLSKGFTVITGETGAGKSIWIDAVNLALGERIESSVVRTGCEFCEISLCFDLKKNVEAKQWLHAQNIPDDQECILRRIIDADGRSRSTINGIPCAQHLIRQFGQLIISIHSQHAHHLLMKSDQQRILLDAYGQTLKQVQEIQVLYQQWSELKGKISDLKQKEQHKEQQASWLQYQLEELQTLDPKPGEWQKINQKFNTLHQSQQLIELLQSTLAILEGNTTKSFSAQLQTVLSNVQKIVKIHPGLNNCIQLVENAQIHLSEAEAELSNFYKKWDFSPEQLESLDQRLSKMYEIARKHKVTPQELPQVYIQLQNEWLESQNYDLRVQELLQAQLQLEQRYLHLADILTQQRKKAAETLSEQVTEQMQKLGMQGGAFCVELQPLENHTVHMHGNERVVFMVCTNPGHGLHPLHKVASGGEISRIHLSLQVIAAQKEGIPILIFDEVDSGLGGKTADIVGQLLLRLSKFTQVICITHLPQVACKAREHFTVDKCIRDQSTYTEIKKISDAERVQEIARMLGGKKITKQTLAHAEEMLLQ